jgi:hypothetical protein
MLNLLGFDSGVLAVTKNIISEAEARDLFDMSEFLFSSLQII